MKKITFLIAFGLFMLTNHATAQIRLIKADTSNGEITIKNFGNSPIDITNYRLCAQFNYISSGDFPGLLVSGDLNLASNAEVIVDWNQITSLAAGSDLCLYDPLGTFGSATNMVDFTQWGTSGNGRESVSVTKGYGLLEILFQ